MVSLEILQTIRDIIAIIGVVGGFLYYLFTMRGSYKSRQTEIFMRLYQTSIDSEGYKKFWRLMSKSWMDFGDYMQKYGAMTNPDEAAERMAHLSTYDGLGIMVRNNVVDVNMVYHMLGLRIIMTWFKFEAVIKDLRKLAIGLGPDYGPGQDYMENLEWLANEMIETRKLKGLPLPVHILHPTSSLLKANSAMGV